MQFLIAFLVVRFLKQNVSSYSSVVKFFIVFHGGRRNVDIYPSNRTVLMLDIVYGIYTLQDILDRVHSRILSGL